MQYQLIEAKSAAELAELVQTRINAGWEPQGGVSVATYGAGVWWYYQAVVKRR